MKCSCFKNDVGETIVRDPWCCWHGDIEWPKTKMITLRDPLAWPGFSLPMGWITFPALYPEGL